MITKLIVRNFKRFDELIFDFSDEVVFVGPNNSGKTTALQAIALWDIGLRKWAEYKFKHQKSNRKKGLIINLLEILSNPIVSLRQLWKDLHVKNANQNVEIQIIAEGFTNNKKWEFGLKFVYANPQQIYCRIMDNKETDKAYEFISEMADEKIGYIMPMSGLVPNEVRYEKGTIKARIGEGRTAEILRNLCYLIYDENKNEWQRIVDLFANIFKVELNVPKYSPVNGEITLSYNEGNTKKIDIANSGTGFRQMLLLFTYVSAFSNSILLIDEPDAHLEPIRQREVYNLLTKFIKDNNSQLIIATHSETILVEAVYKSDIMAFGGNKPHKVNGNREVIKSLRDISYSDYITAEEQKWVLYLEGSTDLDMLKAFAKKLDHPVREYLYRIFVHYLSNNLPDIARKHFTGLKEAVPDLKGIALFDRIRIKSRAPNGLTEIVWQRKEIENYIPLPQTLERFLDKKFPDKEPDLYNNKKKNKLENIKQVIYNRIPPIALENPNDSYWSDTKMSDDFLDKVFKSIGEELDGQILLSKGGYYKLLEYAEPEELDTEIKEKLDAIYKIAKSAQERRL